MRKDCTCTYRNPEQGTHLLLFIHKRCQALWQISLSLRKGMLCLLLGQEKQFQEGKRRLSLEKLIPTAPKAHIYQKGGELGKRQALPSLPAELYPAPLPFSDSFCSGWWEHVTRLVWDRSFLFILLIHPTLSSSTTEDPERPLLAVFNSSQPALCSCLHLPVPSLSDLNKSHFFLSLPLKAKCSLFILSPSCFSQANHLILTIDSSILCK